MLNKPIMFPRPAGISVHPAILSIDEEQAIKSEEKKVW